MNEDLNVPLPPGEPPDDQLLRKIQAQLRASAAPGVSPLPSNTVLMAVGLAIFMAVAFVLAALTKFYALRALSADEMVIYYGAIALLAILFARAVVERMIPGERRLVSSLKLWVSSLLILSGVTFFIFADRRLDDFVSTGVPCLRLGLVSAALSGLIGWRLLRRGYLVSPQETLLLYGFFAGLVGVAVLALHCPIRNSFHIIVWHLGAMIVAGVAGGILGKLKANDI